jgi:hypothetical protein
MRREVEEFAEVHDLALCQAADEEEATGVRSDVGPTRKVEVMVRVVLCVRDLLRDSCCVRSSVHLRILNFSLNSLLSLSPPTHTATFDVTQRYRYTKLGRHEARISTASSANNRAVDCEFESRRK